MTRVLFLGAQYGKSLFTVGVAITTVLLWSRPAFSKSEGTRHIDWIMLPGETVEDAVSQLGLSVEQLCAANPKWDGEVRGVETLPVEVSVDVSVRTLVNYVPKPGETVHGVAKRFNVSPEWVRVLNHIPEHINELPVDVPVVVVASVDGTNQGIDENGDRFSSRIRQPTHIGTSPWFHLKRDRTGWGTVNTVLLLRQVAAEIARKFPGSQPLVFGDISQKWGGRLAPHASHRRGNDVDIAVPRTDSNEETEFHVTSPGKMDVARTWELVRSLVVTGAVEYVFLDYRLQQPLYDFASGTGLSADVLTELFQYPNGRNHRKGIIRHSPGHSNHVHVRFSHDRQNLSVVAVDELSFGDGTFAQDHKRDVVPNIGRTVERRGRCLVGATEESNSN